MDTHFFELWQSTLEQCPNERESRLLNQRYCLHEGKINTLQSIADVEKISRERVRQIVTKGLRKIVGRANRAIDLQQFNAPHAALVYHVRGIVEPEKDGHIYRLAAYLVNDFGYLPPSRTSMDLLIQIVYKTKSEKKKRLSEALAAMGILFEEHKADQANSIWKPRQKHERISKADLAKQAEIVQWLASSKFAVAIDSVPGFCVHQGTHIRLKNGNRYELLEWLKQEGIRAGNTLAGYYVAHGTDGNQCAGGLSFLLVKSDMSSIQQEWEFPSEIQQRIIDEQGLPERAYAPWNEHEDRELSQLFEYGLPTRHLAKHFSRQSGAIRSRLKKLGLG